MTIEDARAVLGVTAEMSADETRRTYLRLTRKHGPETDPQGFARIREAYERLREVAPRGPVEPIAPAAAAEPRAAQLLAPKPPAADHPADQASSADTYRRVSGELMNLPPLAAEKRAAVVERACREHPADANLLSLAIEEMSPFWTLRPRLTAALRRAADHGAVGALAELTFFAPRLVKDDERARLLGSESASDRLLGARLLVFGGNAGAAAVVTEEALASPAEAWPARAALDVALAALSVGEVAAAARIRDALVAHFDTYHDEAAVLGSDLAPLFGILQELLALARTFPVSAILSVARVVRGAGNELANDVGRMLLALPGMPHDKKMMKLLAQQAPLVFQVLDMDVVFGSHGRHATRVSFREYVGGVGFVVIYFVLRVVWMSDHGGGHSASVEPAPVERLAGHVPPETAARLAALRATYEGACAGGAGLARAQECSEMLAEVSILERNGGCDRDLMLVRPDPSRSPVRSQFLVLARTIATESCLRRPNPRSGN